LLRAKKTGRLPMARTSMRLAGEGKTHRVVLLLFTALLPQRLAPQLIGVKKHQ